jgi:hypothetical protein
MSRILGASERAHDTLAPSYRALPIGAYIRIYFPAACTVRPAGFVAQAFLPSILACAFSGREIVAQGCRGVGGRLAAFGRYLEQNPQVPANNAWPGATRIRVLRASRCRTVWNKKLFRPFVQSVGHRGWLRLRGLEA